MMQSLSAIVAAVTPSASLLVLKVTALLCAASVLVLFMRRSSAAHRHFVWLITLASLPGLVVFQSVAPTIAVRVPQNSILGAISSTPKPAVSVAPASNNMPFNGVQASSARTSVSKRQTPSRLAPAASVDGDAPNPHRVGTLPGNTRNAQADVDHASRASSDGCNYSPSDANTSSQLSCAFWPQRANSPLRVRAAILLLWVCGSSIVLARFVTAHVRLAQLMRSARVLRDDDWSRDVQRISKDLNAGSTRLLMHADVTTPFTTGWLRPVLVLPQAAQSYNADRRRAVLTHELAHVARHDYLALCVATSACALFWFHPAVWMAALCMRNESERAADDCVVTGGMAAVQYATHLLALADRSKHAAMTSAALGMAHISQLESRVRAMLDTTRSRIALSKNAARVTGLMSMVALAPFAALRTEVGTGVSVTSHAPAQDTLVVNARGPAPVNFVPSPLAKSNVVQVSASVSSGHDPLLARTFPLVTTIRDTTLHFVQEISSPTRVQPSPADSVFERTIATSDSIAVAIDMDMLRTLTLHWWDEKSVKVRVVLGDPPLHVTFELQGDSAFVHSLSSDSTQDMPAKSRIEVWAPRNGRIIERTTMPGGKRMTIRSMSSLGVAPRDSAASEKPYVFQSQSLRARVDTAFEQIVSAASGERLMLNLPAGGDVTVHGWDQPTARLRARLAGKYETTERVVFARTTEGIGLRTVVLDSSSHYERSAGWSMTSNGRPTFFGAPYTGNRFDCGCRDGQTSCYRQWAAH